MESNVLLREKLLLMSYGKLRDIPCFIACK